MSTDYVSRKIMDAHHDRIQRKLDKINTRLHKLELRSKAVETCLVKLGLAVSEKEKK